MQEVRRMKRDELLVYKKQGNVSTNRIPLVLTYHHKLEGISSIIRDAYSKSITKYPTLKSLFPEQPMVAFRRTRNISDKVVRAKHHIQTSSNTPALLSQGRSKLEKSMNRTQTISNSQTQRTCHIQGGRAGTVGSIYAAECTKHGNMYIGQTKRKLSNRFTNHRFDVINRPEACKLAEHFNGNNCSFDTDLRVSVLEQVSGSQALREYKEDRWITRLQTMMPKGMNAAFSTDFGPIYNKLFN